MLIEEINKYYTKHKNEFEIFVPNPKYDIKLYRTNDKDLLDLQNETGKILTAEYEIIGYYNLINSFWTWAFANPFIEQKLTKSVSKIKTLHKEIATSNKMGDMDRELYLYFIDNPLFYIGKDNLDNLIKMVFFYTTGKWIITRKNNNKIPTQLEFILIKNIIQLK